MVGSQKLISHLQWPFFFVLRSKSQHIVGQQVSSALIGHDFGTLKTHVLRGALAHWNVNACSHYGKQSGGSSKN